MALRMAAAGIGAVTLLGGSHAWAQEALSRAAFFDAAPQTKCCVAPVPEVQINIRSAPVGHFLGGEVRAYAVNSAEANGSRDFGANGVTVRYPLGRNRFYVQGGLGAALRGGATIRLPATPDRLYLDSQVLFERDVALGWRVARGWAVEAAYTRFTHGDLTGVDNPDPNSYGLRLAFHLRR